MSILSSGIIHQKYLPGRILVIIRISVAGVMLVVKGLIQVTSDNTQALLQKTLFTINVISSLFKVSNTFRL